MQPIAVLLCTLITLCGFYISTALSSLVHSPPRITQQPGRLVTYTFGERVALECHATGTPSPSYSWVRNGRRLDIENLRAEEVIWNVGERSEPGTLVMQSTIERALDGSYQCSATNHLGTALTDVIVVRMAVLDSFPTTKDPKVHRVAIGASLTLKCQPPVSHPSSVLHWGVITDDYSPPRIVEPSDRIAYDDEGRLHFINVQAGDSLEVHDDSEAYDAVDSGAIYLCIVYNSFLRNTATGGDQRILLLSSSGYSAHYIVISLEFKV